MKLLGIIQVLKANQRLPSQMNIIPTRTRHKSKAFAFRFLSLKMSAPQVNEISTEPRLTSDTTEIIESVLPRALKYAKSARAMNIEIRGMAQLQWNGVVFFLFGYQSIIHITDIITSW